MIGLVLGLVAMAGADAAAAKDAVRQPKGWVSQSDYPPDALRRGHQGVVYFAVRVGLYGKPLACIVTMGSDWPELDAATCAMMMTRATFKPGTDDKGAPVIGVYAGKIRWALPYGEPFAWVEVPPDSLVPDSFRNGQ